MDLAISPGASAIFRVYFHVPAEYSLEDLVYGTIQADAWANNDGSISTTFIGPVGVVPEPSVIGLFVGGSLLVGTLARGRLRKA